MGKFIKSFEDLSLSSDEEMLSCLFSLPTAAVVVVVVVDEMACKLQVQVQQVPEKIFLFRQIDRYGLQPHSAAAAGRYSTASIADNHNYYNYRHIAMNIV